MCELNIKINIFFIMLFLSSATSAEMYKWIDENGNTHYSQSPPVSDVEVETIAPPKSVDTDSAQKNLQGNLEKANTLRDERLLAQEEKEKEKLEKEQQKEQCQQLKQKLNTLQARARANKKDDDGNIVKMTEEERQGIINDTKQRIDDKCN